VYRVKVKKGKTVYFRDWDSACGYCVQIGLSIKLIKVGGK
jgi:hypothetical protein